MRRSAIVLVMILIAFCHPAAGDSAQVAKAKEDFFARAGERGLSHDRALMVWSLFHVGAMQMLCADRGFIDVAFPQEFLDLLTDNGGMCLCKDEELSAAFRAANPELLAKVWQFQAQSDEALTAICTKYRDDWADISRGLKPADWPYGAGP